MKKYYLQVTNKIPKKKKKKVVKGSSVMSTATATAAAIVNSNESVSCIKAIKRVAMISFIPF